MRKNNKMKLVESQVDPLYRIDDMFFVKAAKLIMILGGVYPVESKKLEAFINGVLMVGLWGCALASFTQVTYVLVNITVVEITVSFIIIF